MKNVNKTKRKYSFFYGEAIPNCINKKERDKFYLTNIRINYLNNDLKKIIEKDIIDKIGDIKNIFNFYNYLNNELLL